VTDCGPRGTLRVVLASSPFGPIPMSVSLGIDLGTTSVSVIAIAAAGRVLAKDAEVHRADVPGLPTGHAEQDPRAIREIAFSLLRCVTAGLREPPASLGVTGQMHGVLLIDDRRGPLGNLVTWQDRRANEPFRTNDPQGPSHLGAFLARNRDAAALPQSGTRPAPGFLGTTLAVLFDRDEIPNAAHRATFLADWFAAELCDTEPVTATSHAASSGLYDVKYDQWSESLLAAARFDPGLLPPVRPCDAIVGTVCEHAAAETGLPVGLPVCNAVGDHQASVLGSVPAGETVLHVNLGTGGQIDWPLTALEAFTHVEGMDTRPLPVGRMMLVGAGLAGGDAFAWVQRTASRWARELGLDAGSIDVYARLLELAEAAGDTTLHATPTFRGTRTHPTASGSFTGITHANFGLGDVARAVLRGIVDGFHAFVEHSGSLAPRATRIIGTGNALERNPLLVRLFAERFGLDVWRPEHDEAAAFGAALLAGTAVGTWSSLESAGERLRLERIATVAG
jgi:sugar (pentulose or hexulose) kinase